MSGHTVDLGYGDEARERVGFFTDTSVCIGCKACEVACKEWNNVPDDNQGFTGESYDNSGALGANRWRHVAFIEQRRPVGGVSVGDSANDLFPLALDPNVHIQEVKAATCDVQPGRRPRGRELVELVEDYRRRAGVGT